MQPEQPTITAAELRVACEALLERVQAWHTDDEQSARPALRVIEGGGEPQPDPPENAYADRAFPEFWKAMDRLDRKLNVLDDRLGLDTRPRHLRPAS